MTLGIHTVNVANPVLDWLRNVAPPSVPGLFVKLHLGDPGGAGTANPSAVTARMQATMSAASGGMISLSLISGSWSMTATELVTHISVWDTVGPAGGNFLFSGILTASKSVVAGDTLTMTVLNVSQGPLAA